MHKKKGNQSVLAGELILTFLKTGKPLHVQNNRRLDVVGTVGRILEAAPQMVYGEHLFNQLVIEAWRKSAIGSLDISRDDFSKVITHHGWHYDENRHHWVRDGDLALAPCACSECSFLCFPVSNLPSAGLFHKESNLKRSWDSPSAAGFQGRGRELCTPSNTDVRLAA